MGLSLKIQQKLLRSYPYLQIGWRWPFHGSRTLKSDQPSWHVVSCKAPLQRCPALPWVKLQILQDPLSSDSLQAWSQERGQRNQCLDWAVFKADSFKANLDQFGLHSWFVETFWSYSIHHSGSTIPFLIRKYVFFNATKQIGNGCLFPYVTLRVTLVFHSCHSKIVTVSPSIPQHPRHLCMWRFCDFILLSGNQTWLSGKATIYRSFTYWNSHLVCECSHNSWFLSICSHLFPWCSNKTLIFHRDFGFDKGIAVSHNFLDETCMTSVLGCLRQALRVPDAWQLWSLRDSW